MEHKIIEWLQQRFPAKPPVCLGIGDDAAVMRTDAQRIVVTTDAIIDQVHFDSTHDSWEQIGHKAIGVNLSDIAAMGARAIAVVVTLALPNSTSLNDVKSLYAGMKRLCDRFGVQIAGGDTNFTQAVLMVSVTAIGQLEDGDQPWLRRARPSGRLDFGFRGLGGQHPRPPPFV